MDTLSESPLSCHLVGTKDERELIDAARRAALEPQPDALEKLRKANKLTARERIDLLVDIGTFVEDALLANALAGNLPADGVVTGRGLIDGRPAVVVANDPMVKAGSWGARTVEKMVRERNIGGVILFGHNMKSEDQVRSLTASLQRLSMRTQPAVPLFVAVDQERGIVFAFGFFDHENINWTWQVTRAISARVNLWLFALWRRW